MKKFVVAAGFLTSLVLASNTYADALSLAPSITSRAHTTFRRTAGF